MVSRVLSSYGRRVSPCLHSGDLGVGKHALTIAAEIAGSVGVRQVDIVKQDVKSSEGKSSNMDPEETHAVRRPQRRRDARISDDKPPNRRRGDDEHKQPSNVLHHMRPRRFDPERKQANGQYHPHNLKRDHLTLKCPTTRIEYIRTIGSHNHPESRSEGDFADVQLLSASTRWSAGVRSNTNFPSNQRRKRTELSVESE